MSDKIISPKKDTINTSVINLEQARYWFILYKDTFVWIKNKDILVYNSKNCKSDLFKINDITTKVFEAFQDIHNLYCIELIDLENSIVQDIISRIERMDAGRLICQEKESLKPIVLPPILNFQPNLEVIENNEYSIIKGKAAHYLNEITLYLNKEDKLTRQLVHLDYTKLKENLSILPYSSVSNVNLYAKSITKYVYWEEILEFFANNNIEISINLRLKEIEDFHLMENNSFFNAITINIEVENGTEKDYRIALSKLKDKFQKINWRIFISEEQEYRQQEEIIKLLEQETYEFIPVFTGKNIAFFKENVYLTNNDLKDIEISRKDIFMNQVLNSNYFGKLTIMSNGKVYAGTQMPAIGTINDSVQELVYKELTQGKSWLRIRDMEPCCDCVYQWLCPPPSDYELIIGSPNLCDKIFT